MARLIIIQLKSHFSIIQDLVNLSILLSQSIKCQYVTYDSIFLIILITLDDFLRVLSIYNQCHIFSNASMPECEYFELNIEDCDEGYGVRILSGARIRGKMRLAIVPLYYAYVLYYILTLT